MIKNNPSYMWYIPDIDTAVHRASDVLCRTWLFNVVNTIDDRFFPRLVAYHEAQQVECHPLYGNMLRCFEVRDDLVHLVN